LTKTAKAWLGLIAVVLMATAWATRYDVVSCGPEATASVGPWARFADSSGAPCVAVNRWTGRTVILHP
jgi:hypothetical protein